MIKTKYIEVEYGYINPPQIDELINAFLEENQDTILNVLDIKYQSNISAVADSGVSAEYYHTSALIIYKAAPTKQPVAHKGIGFLIKCDKCGELSTIETKDAGQNVCYKCKGGQKR
ncbi:sporulation protein Cse60 [Streptococcus hyointestinalis]